jgi:hypothetical protein
MQYVLMGLVALHVLSAVFWAGSSFTLARSGGLGAESLFGPQMGAAAVAIVSGGLLGHLLGKGVQGPSQQVLMAGAGCALVALLLQGLMARPAVKALRQGGADPVAARTRFARVQRVAAVLLALAAACMGAARYAG